MGLGSRIHGLFLISGIHRFSFCLWCFLAACAIVGLRSHERVVVRGSLLAAVSLGDSILSRRAEARGVCVKDGPRHPKKKLG